MQLLDLKQKAQNMGLDRDTVRLYGDLRLISTWEKAIISHQTITVEAETVEDEVSNDDYDPFDAIPFFPEVLKILSKDIEERGSGRQEDVLGTVDCPPPPPPPIIQRPCPIPERHIPGIEKEPKSPIPGEGRGDQRFKNLNLGDRLFEKIREDIGRYFEAVSEDLKYCLDMNYMDISHYQEARSIIEIMQWNIKNKHSIFDIVSTVPYFQREGFQKLIPFAVHELFKDCTPSVTDWDCTRESYWLIIEKPSAIPTLAEEFGGIFIPNKIHELGVWTYVWKFPGMIQAENFFYCITDAKKYCMVPANSSLKVSYQLVGGGLKK